MHWNGSRCEYEQVHLQVYGDGIMNNVRERIPVHWEIEQPVYFRARH
jgi:hypothetical protein